MGGRSTGMVRLLRSVVAASYSLDLLVFLLQPHSTFKITYVLLLLQSTLEVMVLFASSVISYRNKFSYTVHLVVTVVWSVSWFKSHLM